jgi:hypothetical protein
MSQQSTKKRRIYSPTFEEKFNVVPGFNIGKSPQKTQKKKQLRRKTKRQRPQRTQKTLREELPDSQLSAAVDRLGKDVSELNIGRDIIVKAAIWGHGAQTSHTQTFQPLPNIQLNIQGFAESGQCSLGSPASIIAIDTFLKETNIWPLPKAALESEYVKLYHNIQDPVLKKKAMEKARYEHKKNYGDPSETTKGDKTYYGSNDPNDPFLLSLGVPRTGPLLRIYKIMIDGVNILPPGSFYDVQLSNGVTLSQIIREIEIHIALHTRGPIDIMNTINKLIINLFDNSCNSTSGEPTIGAVTPAVKKVSK